MLASIGQVEAAERAFREAIARGTNDTRAYAALARLKIGQGEVDEALAVLEEGLSERLYDSRLHFMQASLLHTQGRFEEAVKVYRAMLERNPSLDLAANNLAALIADAYPENEELLTEARALAERFQASQNPYYLDTLGWVLYRSGDLNQAAIFLERADQLLSGVATFRYHLAHVRIAQGQTDQAEALLAELLEDERPFPHRERVKELLDNLRSSSAKSASA